MQKIIVAIDGHAGAGKSSLARGIARELRYVHINSGAIYRAIALYLHKHNISLADAQAVEHALLGVNIILGKNTLSLNGQHVFKDLYTHTIDQQVPKVSLLPAVRRKVKQLQHGFGKKKGIVMDGRDIGTHIFPDAALKIFLTATLAVRAARRYQGYLRKNSKVALATILTQLAARDKLDQERLISPLKKAEDAILIDNTNLTFFQTLTQIMNLAKPRLY